MSNYRCYFLNTDGYIERVENIDADDDAGALYMSRVALSAQSRIRAFELWQGDRRVGCEFDEPLDPATPMLQLMMTAVSG